MTYSRAGSTTIGPGCLTAVFGMGTGVAIRVWSPGDCPRYQLVGVRVACSLEGPEGGHGIKAVKPLAVSTGPLSALPRVHFRPIDPVVFREPSPQRGRRP